MTDSGRIRQEDAERARSGAWSLEHDCCLNAHEILMVRETILEQSVISIGNMGIENDQVVWRSLQTYRGLRRQARPRLAKSAGFTDALIVQEALRAASDTGGTLNAVDTFDAAMQRFPRTSSPRKQSDEGRHPPTHHGPAPTHSHGGRNEIPVPLTWRRYRLRTGLTLPSAVHVPRFTGSRAAVVAQGAATEVDLVNSWTI